MILPRIIMCDDEQIPAPGLAGGVRGCLPGSSGAPAQVQPQEVYSAPVAGLPGAQGVLAPRLSRFGRSSQRPPRPCQPDRHEGRAPLHHPPESRCPALGGCSGPQDVRRRARSGAAGQSPQTACSAGGRGRHGPGVAAHQPLLRQASLAWRRPRPAHRLLPSTARSSLWSTAAAT